MKSAVKTRELKSVWIVCTIGEFDKTGEGGVALVTAARGAKSP